jgi:cell division initiation protein
MKITPLDIRQQQFTVRFRGFDAEEVDTFLEMIADEYETVIEENRKLAEEIEKRDRDIRLFVENEKRLKKEVDSNKTVQEEVKQTAGKEAQTIIKNAELKSKEILAGSEKELEKLRKEFEELKEQKKKLLNRIKEIVDSFSKLLQKKEEK